VSDNNTTYASADHVKRPALAVAVIIITVFAMAFADAIVKAVSSLMPLWQVFVVRSLIAIPLITLVAFLGPATRLRPLSLRWTLLRSFLLVLMYIAIYAAIPVLSLSAIAASLYTGPLFIAIFSALMIGEPVGPGRWAAIILGFIGVLFIIRPGGDTFSWAALIPVAAAVFYALAAVITRAKCPDENPVVMALGLNYALLATGMIASASLLLLNLAPETQALYPFLVGDWISMTDREWAVLTVLALLIVGIGVGLAKAYQSGPPAVIATFDYSYLIFAAFWSFIFFGEVPDRFTMIGIGLIFCSGLLVLNPRLIERPRLA
jgi:drug/metabolite transporter (DMT)-like permease